MGRYSGRTFRLVFMCVVSIILFVMELAVAHIGNSLSLASDAFAVLSHLLSMVIGLFGLRASTITYHPKSTFGFLRADVVGAFGNSIFAVALMFSILVEAIKRYINPQKTEEALLVLAAGIIGLFFNVLNYVILDCCYCSAGRPPEDLEDPATGKHCRWAGSFLVDAFLGGRAGGSTPMGSWRGLLSPSFCQRVTSRLKSPVSRVAAGHCHHEGLLLLLVLSLSGTEKGSRQVERGVGGCSPQPWRER